jgi:toxin FitB
MILIDTNVLSELMKGSPNRRVLDWVDHHLPTDLWVSAVSEAEIALGIALLPSGKRQDALALAADAIFADDFAERCLPFDHATAGHYAQLVAHRTRLGLPISTEDA